MQILVTVDGIVVGQRNAGDNGLYLDVLTKEYGVIEVMAHGAKKINSKSAGAASLFSYSAFCLSKNGLKYTVNSVSPKYSFYGISGDIVKLSLAAYFSEIIKYTSASEQQESDIFRFFAITLYELEKERIELLLIKSVYELRICALLGLMPDLRACISCACYEHEEMYFLLEESGIICGDCSCDTDIYGKTSFLLDSLTLYLMRRTIYSQPEKIYKLNKNINAGNIKELNIISEENLLYQLGRGFKTLDYFKKL